MIEFRNGRPYGAQEDLDKPAKDGFYLTVKEFAELYGVTEELVRQWKKRGVVDGINYQGHAYIRGKTEIRLKQCHKSYKIRRKFW